MNKDNDPSTKSSSRNADKDKKLRKLFMRDEFFDMDLNREDTTCRTLPSKKSTSFQVTTALSTNIRNSDPLMTSPAVNGNSPSCHRPRKTKSDLADQLIVRKISSDKDLHRRVKSNINVSKLASYNYRVVNDNNKSDVVSNDPSSSKLQSIPENLIENLTLESNKTSECSGDTIQLNGHVKRKSKLEAEVRASLISQLGAIGLPMNDRPVGLPPKPKDELEYQQKLCEDMIRRSKQKLDHQTKSIIQKTINNDTKELKLSLDSIFWHSLVDNPNFMTELKKTNTLRKISNGMPSYIRGKIWKLFSYDKISIAEEVFDEMFNSDHRHHCAVDDSVKSSKDATCDPTQMHETIVIDADRTLPYLKLFQKDHPMHNDLCKLLCVFHHYNSNVGYAQGMSYPMAIFLLNLQPFDCFVCFNNLINDPIFTSLYTCDPNKVDEIYSLFETVLSLENDRLTTHIHRISLAPSMYLLDWLMSTFCKVFSLEVVSRIFDNYFIEGSIFFFKCAIMIVNHHEKQILSSNDPIYCAQILTKPIYQLNEDTIFKQIKKIGDYNYLYKNLEMFLKFK